MKIPLGDDAIVEVEDGHNYVLKILRKGTWRGAGYFGGLEAAVAKAVMLGLADDVVEARALIKGIHRTVCAAREVTRNLRALTELKMLLDKPTTDNLDRARQLIGRIL